MAEKSLLIDHPENLIKGEKYTVLILSGTKYRRISGRFIGLESAYNGINYNATCKPDRKELIVLLQRASERVIVVWKESKDWRRID